LRRRRKDIETLCENSPRRLAKDIRLFGASVLRRWRRDIPICEDKMRRSAKDIQPIGAGISQSSKNIEMSGDSPQRSP
jgi:hypothetical protein